MSKKLQVILLTKFLNKHHYKGHGKFNTEISTAEYIYGILHISKKIFLKELVNISEIPRTTVLDIIKKFHKRNWIIKDYYNNEKRGRSKARIRLRVKTPKKMGNVTWDIYRLKTKFLSENPEFYENDPREITYKELDYVLNEEEI